MTLTRVEEWNDEESDILFLFGSRHGRDYADNPHKKVKGNRLEASPLLAKLLMDGFPVKFMEAFDTVQ